MNSSYCVNGSIKMSQLNKNLTLWGGTILFLNVVIGAGLLVVPGLAYQQVGNFAILSWLFCSLIAMPLLLVFVILGRNYPDAGGIAHYAKRAFGPWVQKIAAFLLLGAVIFGIPSIAMTAGYYLDSVLPFSVHGYAILLLLAAVAAHGVGGESLGKILGLIGSSVLLILIALLVVGFFGLGKSSLDHTVANPFDFTGGTLVLSLAPFMMIFFAFTGWEIGAHAAEEFENPRRDFPWAMFLSFIVATVFYLAIALLIQMSDIKSGFAAPFIEVTRPLLGESGQFAVATVAALVIYANLFGVVWGVSRLVYS
ncbi:MAG: APC family permease, partial [Alphaproteobacteria bacterium]|nr:APC family permease [Alphaproteobacteria bacterium]